MVLLLSILFRFLEVIFFLGVLGSLSVAAMTMVEELSVLFEADEPAAGTSVVADAAATSADFYDGRNHSRSVSNAPEAHTSERAANFGAARTCNDRFQDQIHY